MKDQSNEGMAKSRVIEERASNLEEHTYETTTCLDPFVQCMGIVDDNAWLCLLIAYDGMLHLLVACVGIPALVASVGIGGMDVAASMSDATGGNGDGLAVAMVICDAEGTGGGEYEIE